jgi:hypothetical protein
VNDSQRIERVEFLSEFEARAVGRKQWALLTPLQAKVFYANGDEEWVIVPAGFVTDGASVPRLPLAYMLFGGRARKAATLHDYCYDRRRNRAWADAVFLAAMENEESSFVRGFMHLGVRVGGWTRYQEAKTWPEHSDDSPS